MILMDAEGNRRKSLRCPLKEVSQKHVVGVLPGAWLAWTMTGLSVFAAARMTASNVSRLVTLKAGIP